MVDRIAFLSCRLDIETKKKLKQKADELGLDITDFIRKIADEDIVILDKNIRRLLDAIRIEVGNSCSAASDTNFN